MSAPGRRLGSQSFHIHISWHLFCMQKRKFSTPAAAAWTGRRTAPRLDWDLAASHFARQQQVDGNQSSEGGY